MNDSGHLRELANLSRDGTRQTLASSSHRDVESKLLMVVLHLVIIRAGPSQLENSSQERVARSGLVYTLSSIGRLDLESATAHRAAVKKVAPQSVKNFACIFSFNTNRVAVSTNDMRVTARVLGGIEEVQILSRKNRFVGAIVLSCHACKAVREIIKLTQNSMSWHQILSCYWRSSIFSQVH